MSTFTLAINPVDNDFILNNQGKFLYTQGVDEVSQRIRVTLQHYYGEYFLNVPGGVPWYELILGSKDYHTVNLLLRSAILEVPGVTSIINFSVSLVNRSWKLDVTVDTSEGTVDLTYYPG